MAAGNGWNATLTDDCGMQKQLFLEEDAVTGFLTGDALLKTEFGWLAFEAAGVDIRGILMYISDEGGTEKIAVKTLDGTLITAKRESDHIDISAVYDADDEEERMTESVHLVKATVKACA